jgi:hypothetical protein
VMEKNMRIRFSNFIINQNNLFVLLMLFMFQSCSHKKGNESKIFQEKTADDYFTKIHETRCESNSDIIKYTAGDLICTKNNITINSMEKLIIEFIVVDKNSEDPYDYGYQELHRYKNGKIFEKLKLRRDDDAYWSEVPFVRIRKQKYLADLDGDGFLEFAIFPFHPGSAIWGTVRIFSLKDKIELWGEGRYQFEGDTFVQLGCMRCSKFIPEECKKCH